MHRALHSGAMRRALLVSALALWLCPFGFGQELQALGDDTGWSWGWSVEERLRFQREENKAFGGAPPEVNDFWLNRFRLFGKVEHEDGYRFGIELIDARITGNERPPLAIDRNDLDVRNLYAEFDTGETSRLTLGRSDLQYGSQRLISPLEWSNTRRTFDGAIFKHDFDGGTVDVFATKPVVVSPHSTDHDDDSRSFSGVYSSFALEEQHNLDAYALALNERSDKIVSGTSRQGKLDLYTLGLRHHGQHDSGFDWDTEVAKQTGRSAGDRISAGMVTAEMGYRFTETAYTPRIGISLDWASGDDDPTDSRNESFNQLFPLGHKYLGRLDLVGRSNIIDVQPNVSLQLNEKTTFTVEYHMFSLDDRRDALINPGGGVVLQDPTGASGTDVGDEIDLILTHTPDDWAIVDHILLGYSHFEPGSFISDQRGTGNVDFYYAQFTKRF